MSFEYEYPEEEHLEENQPPKRMRSKKTVVKDGGKDYPINLGRIIQMNQQDCTFATQPSATQQHFPAVYSIIGPRKPQVNLAVPAGNTTSIQDVPTVLKTSTSMAKKVQLTTLPKSLKRFQGEPITTTKSNLHVQPTFASQPSTSQQHFPAINSIIGPRKPHDNLLVSAGNKISIQDVPTVLKNSTSMAKNVQLTTSPKHLKQTKLIVTDKQNNIPMVGQSSADVAPAGNDNITMEVLFKKLENIERIGVEQTRYLIALKRIADEQSVKVDKLRKEVNVLLDIKKTKLRLPLTNQAQLDEIEANFNNHEEELRTMFGSFVGHKIFDMFRYFVEQILSNVDYYNWSGTKAPNSTDDRIPKNASKLQIFQLLLEVGVEKMCVDRDIAVREMVHAIKAFHGTIAAREKRRKEADEAI